jgi:hypothetical protein
MGYFKGFMSAVQGSVTEPNENGRISRFTIKGNATFDQAIHAFLKQVDEYPGQLGEDAGIVVSGSLLASGLATFQEEPVVYVKKQ